tara:strand:- start:116 stop:475 length:360 start_codon:yes stop_codon:yes gene_type:complete
MAGNNKLSFGPASKMPEVPKGEHAELTFSETGDLLWEHKEDGEYGMKFFIPIVLLTHPSVESLPSSGSAMHWVSKAEAAEQIYNVITESIEAPGLKKEIFGKTWKLTRSITGSYRLDQV